MKKRELENYKKRVKMRMLLISLHKDNLREYSEKYEYIRETRDKFRRNRIKTMSNSTGTFES